MDSPKIAFVFPGQGAQKVGMGLELSERFPESSQLLTQANEALGFDLKRLCFEGPEEELFQTQNTQPAILAVSAAALAIFRQNSAVKPDFVAGHSLGEFSALYAAGAYSFDDALRLVRKRGEYMSKASGGAMAAVIGLDAASIEAICSDIANGGGSLQPANYNGEGQTVIAGSKAAIERAIPILNEKGAKRVITLNVAAAFHTPDMSDASEKLAVDLDAQQFANLEAPLVNNIDAKIIQNAEEARDGLKRQVTGAVRWTQVMERLMENGVRTIVEFGPGRTLLGMFKKLDKTLTLCNVEDEKSLNKTLEVLK